MGGNWILFYCLLNVVNSCYTRSIYRSVDNHMPCIEVSSSNTTHSCTFYDSHIKKIIFNVYDDDFFRRHLLPMKYIYFRNHSQKKIHGRILSSLLEDAVTLIKNNTSKKMPMLEHFTILKAKDINKHCNAGSFILKYKNYPFVVKIFVSNPSEILRRENKGFEQLMLYYLSGGATRHLMGFSRIKNMEHVRSRTAQHPYGSTYLSFPRKWFWLPKNPSWLTLRSVANNVQSVFPETYAIICDWIEWEYKFSIFSKKDREQALLLSNYLHHCIDSHIDNFGIEKHTKKLVIIDFEYFPHSIFSRTQSHITSYTEWYKELIFKVLYELLGRQKYRRTLDFDRHLFEQSKKMYCDYSKERYEKSPLLD